MTRAPNARSTTSSRRVIRAKGRRHPSGLQKDCVGHTFQPGKPRWLGKNDRLETPSHSWFEFFKLGNGREILEDGLILVAVYDKNAEAIVAIDERLLAVQVCQVFPNATVQLLKLGAAEPIA